MAEDLHMAMRVVWEEDPFAALERALHLRKLGRERVEARRVRRLNALDVRRALGREALDARRLLRLELLDVARAGAAFRPIPRRSPTRRRPYGRPYQKSRGGPQPRETRGASAAFRMMTRRATS